MSKNLQPCSGDEAVRKLERAGWLVARQKGSHLMLTKPGFQWTLSVPQHNELGPGLLRKTGPASGSHSGRIQLLVILLLNCRIAGIMRVPACAVFPKHL